MNGTVVSLSGGMDSAVLLAHALHNARGSVTAVGFAYGSKHNRYEQHCAGQLAHHYGVPYRLIDLTEAMRGFKSSLMRDGGAVPDGHYTDRSMSATVVPARNMIFASFLAGVAWSVGADKVMLGVHAGDHAIYPDCRPEWFAPMSLAVYEGTDKRVSLVTPFLCVDKKFIVECGLDLKVPFELTRTCYKDQPAACGKCGACVERQEAFFLNGAHDPVEYEYRDPSFNLTPV